MATSRRTALSPTLLLLGLAGLGLQGCAQQVAGPTGPTARLYAVDQAGAAKQCKASKPTLANGKESQATMTVGNDGGWCAISVQNGDTPYASALLIARPAHGTAYIHPVGDDTRIDYTPDRGFAGSDSFTVRLIPGSPSLRVAVTVTGQGVARASAPAPATKSSSSKTKR